MLNQIEYLKLVIKIIKLYHEKSIDTKEVVFLLDHLLSHISQFKNLEDSISEALYELQDEISLYNPHDKEYDPSLKNEKNIQESISRFDRYISKESNLINN